MLKLTAEEMKSVETFQSPSMILKQQLCLHN